VDVCEVCGIGEVAVEEAGEEGELEGGREQRGDYVEACLPSGLVVVDVGRECRKEASKLIMN
jgi:hypothetical protein